MRVQNGEISLIGSRRVDGTLMEHQDLIQNGITYDAFVKDRRIAIGSIPDFGEQRSFARPNADPSHEGHHITILPSFDFNVKIAADKLAYKDLGALKVSLYRFKEHVHELKLAETPVKDQYEKQTRVVAVMNGININRLKEDVKMALKKSFLK